MKMEIKKSVSYILCIGFVLSSVSAPIYAVQTDDVQEKMNVFQRSLKSFQRVSSRYNRCMQGKCSKEEKQKLWAELKSVGKKTAKYGALVIGAIIVVGGTSLFLSGISVARKRIRRVQAKYRLPNISPVSPEYKLLSRFVWSKNPDLSDFEGHEFPFLVIQAVAELYYGLEGSKQKISLDKVNLFLVDKFPSLKYRVTQAEVITFDEPQVGAEKDQPESGSMKDVD